ncbi:hypothetical protein INT47_011188 [Mucor saturninus]|uniref:Galactose oxidase n=1 Tax=Mucor saturninus TaxID=64648 RepID=A0A8H7VFW9_9FUNG|nr:hypothetical protein INT47_011188 [Mucor saturninus]
MYTFCLVLVLLIVSTANYTAAQIHLKSRSDASCGYFSNKIYCYGGTPTNAPDDPDYVSMLDLLAYDGSKPEELENKWVTVNTAENDFNTTQHRSHQQYMQLSNENTLLINGGDVNYTLPALETQTLAFNITTLSWKAYPSYQEPPFGTRQIFRASSVFVPEFGVGFYGGSEANTNSSWSYPGVDMSVYNNVAARSRYIGYTSLTFFDIRNETNPWSVYPIQKNIPSGFAYHQKSIFDAKSNRIFFFGGVVKDTVATTKYATLFSSSMVFDFVKGEWGSQPLTGQGPTTRFGHSVTLIGAKQRHVLVYGGQGVSPTDSVRSDYCYTLDLDSYNWHQQNISAPPDVSLVRTQHSAVAVDNDTVFIIFGIIEKTKEATLSILMLNVSDPYNVTLNEKYEIPKVQEALPAEAQGIKQNSVGKTIGIAVGVTAAGLILVAVIIFLIIRRRKAAKRKEDILMEVNWDEIDQTCAEKPPAGYSPQLTEDVTVVNEVLVPDAILPKIVHDSETKLQRPDAIDESDESTMHKNTLQKPNVS